VRVLYTKFHIVFVINSWIPRDTCNPEGSWGDHAPRLNTLKSDSEQVPRGKDEKNPGEGSEIEPEIVLPTKRVKVADSATNTVPIEEWAGEYVPSVKVKSFRLEAKGKPSLKRRKHDRRNLTRNRVIYPWPGWTRCKRRGRPEPVSAAKGWDELWLGVICQSNSEIAGSPRNSFRASGRWSKRG